MAPLKFCSSIEHVFLQEWIFSASWLQWDFSAWTFTDTFLLAVLLIPSLHHHPKCICLNLLPLSCPMFFSHLQSFLQPYLHSTHLLYIFPGFSILFVLESSLLFLQETCALTGTMKYHKALSLPERTASRIDPHTHDHEVWPEVPAIDHHYRALSESLESQTALWLRIERYKRREPN